MKVELAFEMVEDKDWVDVECNLESDMTKIIVGGATDVESTCKTFIIPNFQSY